MTDDVLTPEQVEAVRDAILYGHDPRQPTVAEYVALADSHEALRAALADSREREREAVAALAAVQEWATAYRESRKAHADGDPWAPSVTRCMRAEAALLAFAARQQGEAGDKP